MRYLGFPISSRNEGMGAFKNIVAKIGKKLHPWKGKHLSWGGGALILKNSSLTSMSTFIMRKFMLHDGVHKQMDSIRSQFFLRGNCDKFKYHMIKWDNVCVPTDLGGGGLGLLIPESLMNIF